MDLIIRKGIMKSKAILCSFLLVFSTGLVQGQQIQQVLDSLQKETGFHGGILTIKGMGVDQSFATGYADTEAAVKMKLTDKMLVGSTGKTFFATAALQLIEKGKLTLNQKVIEYLGKYDWFLKLPNANDITIKQLMNHTTGIREYVYFPDLWKKLNDDPDKVWTVEERLSYVTGTEPLFEAGKGWAYGDVNYIILGAVLEEVLDETLYEYVTANILKPLDLQNTKASNHRNLKGLVPGYTGKIPLFGGLPEKMVTDGVYAFNPQMEWTGGGFISNTQDLTKWVIALIKENELLDSTTLKKMTSAVSAHGGMPAKTGYGLGLQIWETSLGTAYGHTGFMPGYLTAMAYIPEHDLAMAIQVNTDNTNANFKRGVTTEGLLDAIGKELLKDK